MLKLHGIVTILITPFNDDGTVDYDSLERVTEFNIDQGVHGVGLALGSEILRLSESERNQLAEVVVKQVDGRVPVVVNTGAAGTDLAIKYSLAAQERGADAVMVLPPGGIVSSAIEIRDYYKSISDAIDIPIVLQDANLGQVAPALVREIANESSNVRFCKMETAPTPARIAATVDAVGDSVGVFGGAGGNYFIEELRRGSIGTMPGCSMPRAFVRVWDLFMEGKIADAEQTFMAEVLPVNRVAGQGMGLFYHVHKHILQRQGVIKTTHVRRPTAPLDDVTLRELDEVLEKASGISLVT